MMNDSMGRMAAISIALDPGLDCIFGCSSGPEGKEKKLLFLVDAWAWEALAAGGFRHRLVGSGVVEWSVVSGGRGDFTLYVRSILAPATGTSADVQACRPGDFSLPCWFFLPGVDQEEL